MQFEQDKVTVIVSLLDIMKTCLQSGASSSIITLRFSQCVEPFLDSPNVKLRIASKMVLHCLRLHHGQIPVRYLQQDEFDFILQTLTTSLPAQGSDFQIADLLAFLVASAHYPDNRSVMLKGNVSDVLSDLIDTGTELEQTLVAELASMMLSDTPDDPPGSSIPIPEGLIDIDTNVSQGK